MSIIFVSFSNVTRSRRELTRRLPPISGETSTRVRWICSAGRISYFRDYFCQKEYFPRRRFCACLMICEWICDEKESFLFFMRESRTIYITQSNRMYSKTVSLPLPPSTDSREFDRKCREIGYRGQAIDSVLTLDNSRAHCSLCRYGVHSGPGSCESMLFEERCP